MTARPRQLRLIGTEEVSAVAFGAASWSFSDDPGWDELRLGPRSDEGGIRAIHTALECGITLIDTARLYTRLDHPGHSEALVARALSQYPGSTDRVIVATKGGHYRLADSAPIDGSPATIRRHCELSLELLGLDCIPLYQLHYPDPERPIAAVMKTFVELRDEGLIRLIGIGNVSRREIDEARTVAPIASVQNEFSPIHQDDRDVVEYCAEEGIAYLAYSPLGGTRMTVENRNGRGARHLRDVFPAAARVAERRGISIHRLALAWLLTLTPTIIPIVGATREESVRDSAGAADVELDPGELAGLDFTR
jgi:aryl-alcohol dehydrogenase-like predicted oxidoreductase